MTCYDRYALSHTFTNRPASACLHCSLTQCLPKQTLLWRCPRARENAGTKPGTGSPRCRTSPEPAKQHGGRVLGPLWHIGRDRPTAYAQQAAYTVHGCKGHPAATARTCAGSCLQLCEGSMHCAWAVGVNPAAVAQLHVCFLGEMRAAACSAGSWATGKHCRKDGAAAAASKRSMIGAQQCRQPDRPCLCANGVLSLCNLQSGCKLRAYGGPCMWWFIKCACSPTAAAVANSKSGPCRLPAGSPMHH